MDRNGTHNFIKFPPKYEDQHPRMWFLLGQIEAKLAALRVAPIPPAVSSELRGVSQQKGVHATTAIEGNSFSEEEVKKIIAGELSAPPSLQYQQREIENMLHALNTVADQALAGESVFFDLELLNHYHSLVLQDLGEGWKESVSVGELRQHNVRVGDQYLAPAPEDCKQMVQDYCSWLNSLQDGSPNRDMAMRVVEAIVAHVYFNWIHPYGDGNGRMARLIEFMLLLQSGVPDIAAHLLTNHYNKTRDRYYHFLKESHGEWNGGYSAESDLNGFLYYALEGFRDGLDKQLTRIVAMQTRSIWRDEIDATFMREFSGNLTEARQRQKRLLLDLSDRPIDKPVMKHEIPTISQTLARAYAGKSMRTVMRDLNALEQLNLLKRVDGGGFLPNYGILQGFRARTRASDD